ncbi:MAG: hypothetical protein ACJAUL_003239 [Paraglaciecola sp.]
MSRCVRHAFLCGTNKYSGQSYEHRSGSVEEGLLFLDTVFAINIYSRHHCFLPFRGFFERSKIDPEFLCANGVMSNQQNAGSILQQL